MCGAHGRIRTSDRLVRSQVLYPAELHALKLCSWDAPRTLMNVHSMRKRFLLLFARNFFSNCTTH